MWFCSVSSVNIINLLIHVIIIIIIIIIQTFIKHAYSHIKHEWEAQASHQVARRSVLTVNELGYEVRL